MVISAALLESLYMLLQNTIESYNVLLKNATEEGTLFAVFSYIQKPPLLRSLAFLSLHGSRPPQKSTCFSKSVPSCLQNEASSRASEAGTHSFVVAVAAITAATCASVTVGNKSNP